MQAGDLDPLPDDPLWGSPAAAGLMIVKPHGHYGLQDDYGFVIEAVARSIFITSGKLVCTVRNIAIGTAKAMDGAAAGANLGNS